MRDYPELKQEFIKWKNIVNRENRFYDKTSLLKDLHDFSNELELIIPKRQSFFRGRIFNLDDKVSNRKEYEEWLYSDDGVFQGYGAEESGAPSSKNAKEGRLNENGISFLYTCSDIDTVIYELRPTREEVLSIAEFITKRKVCFADLTKFDLHPKGFDKYVDIVKLVADEFATPHYAGHNYAFTQYLAGHFMNMGFNGVVFESSLNPKGKNFVFFNPKDCKAINSRLHKVDELSISANPIDRKDV